MARPLVVIAAFRCLAVPAALAAPPADKGKPEKNQQSATTQAAQGAAKSCKAERAAGAAAFKAKYGSNGLGKCIAALQQKAKDDDEAEQNETMENAAKKCKAERGTTPATMAAFKAKYGTNHNKANAFGKCVSKLAKAQNS